MKAHDKPTTLRIGMKFDVLTDPVVVNSHVSFAKAWMLICKGVAHALEYDFRLVPPAVMAPLQRRLEGGLRQTLTVLLGSEVSELARERAMRPTCFGGLGIRVSQMGFAAQATFDLHKAVMTTLQGAHPGEVTALSAKADLLTAGLRQGYCRARSQLGVRGKPVGSGQTGG